MREILDEWFFPASDQQGRLVIPAPWEAVKKRDELRKGWLMNYRGFFGDEPSVSLAPGKMEDKVGYFVRREIFKIKNSRNIQELIMLNDWLN